MVRQIRRSVLLILEGDTEQTYVDRVRCYESTHHIRRPINAKGGGGIVNALERTRWTPLWGDAATRMPLLDTVIPPRSRGSTCPLCASGSALPHLIELLLGK
jgi:hypothetical protein